MRKKDKRIPPETSLNRYDWTKATRGRYSARFRRSAHVVLLSPDLWRYFGSAEAVEQALKLLVRASSLASRRQHSTRRSRPETNLRRPRPCALKAKKHLGGFPQRRSLGRSRWTLTKLSKSAGAIRIALRMRT